MVLVVLFFNPSCGYLKEIACLTFGSSILQYHSSVLWLNCLLAKNVFVMLNCSNYLCGLDKDLIQLGVFFPDLLLINRVNGGLATYYSNVR